MRHVLTLVSVISFIPTRRGCGDGLVVRGACFKARRSVFKCSEVTLKVRCGHLCNPALGHRDSDSRNLLASQPSQNSKL